MLFFIYRIQDFCYWIKYWFTYGQIYFHSVKPITLSDSGHFLQVFFYLQQKNLFKIISCTSVENLSSENGSFRFLARAKNLELLWDESISLSFITIESFFYKIILLQIKLSFYGVKLYFLKFFWDKITPRGYNFTQNW